VQIDLEEQIAAGLKLGEIMPDALSSTAQDIARGKRTEIDSLNGYVARLGEELGVPTPINYTLCKLVKLLEEAA
jgi:2-dehydropantoate 2-reductase